MADSPAQSAFLSRLDSNVPGAPAWFAERRAAAGVAFRASGLPHSKLEDWRFTPLDRVRASDYTAAPSGRFDLPLPEPQAGAIRVLLVDGRVDATRSALGSLPAGVRVESLADAIRRDDADVRSRLGAIQEPKSHALADLNTALFADGVLIALADGTELAQPIEIVHVQSEADAPTVVFNRSLIVLGAHTRAVVCEHFVSAAPEHSLTVPVTEIALDAGARLDWIQNGEHNPGALALARVASVQERDSTLRSFVLALGAELARTDIHACLGGSGAHVDLFGLSVGTGRQHLDHHTTIDHAMPQTTSFELYKGIFDERSRGVFHGRIHVRPDAQRIDARQNNRNLLLSNSAGVHTKPQLEIYADDVKCAHGATVGQLDPAHVFYLRSRGIDLEQARAVLTHAFARDVLREVPLDSVRERLEAELQGRLIGGGA